MLKKLFSLVSVFALALFARAEVVQDAYVDFTTMTEYNFWKGGLPEGATFGLEDGALTIVNPTAKGNWDFQYFVADGLNLTPGQVYDVEIVMSGSVAGTGNLVFGSWGVGVDNNLVIPAGEGTYTTKVACPTNETIHLCMQTGSYVGTIKVYSVKVSHDTECGPELNALTASNIEQKANPWDNQVYFELETPLVQGKEYVISVDLYGDAEGKIPIWGDGKKIKEDSDEEVDATQYGVGWGDYIVNPGEWTTTTRFFTADNNLKKFNFCFGNADQYTGTYLYFDNVVLTEKGSDVNLLSNGDFTNGVTKPWGKPSWHSFTLKVETAPAHPEPEPMHPNTVWVGPKTMNWGDGVMLNKELFTNVCAGDTLIVKYDTTGNGTFQTIFGGWGGVNIGTYDFWKYDFAQNDGNGTVTFIFPESFNAFEYTHEVGKDEDKHEVTETRHVFDEIKAEGIVFQGPATLNSIIYCPFIVPEVDNIGALAELTEEEAQKVKLTLTDAKVTYYAEAVKSYFIEDATGAMMLAGFNEESEPAAVEALAQGKAVTGTVIGQYFEGNFMCFATDVDITASEDADVTYGAEMTVAEAKNAANANKLVTFVASDNLTIVNEENMLIITEGENQLLVNDNFNSLPEDYEWPAAAEKVTGIIMNQGMIALVPRSAEDIVPAVVAQQFVTDVLNYDNTTVANSGTAYEDIKDVTVSSEAAYYLNAAKGKESIQLRASSSTQDPSGIVTTTSGGILNKITVTFNEATADARVLDVYVKNEAYTSPGDLYNADTQGTKVASITKEASSYTFEGDYQYIGLRSNSGAMYLDEIQIEWEKLTDDFVFAPVFSPAPGMVKAGTEVELSTQTEGAEIYYTTDETEPTATSTKYTEPIVINDYTVIKAVAIANGNASKVVTAEYSVMPEIEDLSPIMDFPDGTPFTVNCELTVAYANGDNVYVYDGTYYGLIYKSNLGFEAGDVIAAGWDASLTIYKGLYEIVPTSDLTKSESEPKTFAPTPVDAEDAEAVLVEANMNRYFTLQGVVFDAATPAGKSNFTGKMGEFEVPFRNNFTIESVEAGTYNVTGFLNVYNTIQFLPVSYEAAEVPVEYTVHFDNSASKWETVYAYVWSAEARGIYVAWPGEEMTKGDDDKWSYTISDFEPTHVIFHNNNGKQTEDLPFVHNNVYVGEAPAPANELYLRGTINEWGTSLKFETEDNVNYTLLVNEVIPAGTEFKIANADYAVSYTYTESEISPNVEYTFVDGDGMNNNAKIAEGIQAGAKVLFNVETKVFKIDGTTGIFGIDTDDEAVYYNMQGVRLAHPAPGQACIRVVNGVATKVVVK